MEYHHVTVTEMRPKLTWLTGRVEHGGDVVYIYRHRRHIAVLVSVKDYDRVVEAHDEDVYGPINPATGRRPGAGWRDRAPIPEKLRQFWRRRDGADTLDEGDGGG